MTAPQSASPSGSLPPADRPRWDAALHALWCGAWVLLVARPFYAQLFLQLSYTAAAGDPHRRAGDWSAPLDDVFIHLDFARSAARGAPFEWSQGNGYSSGGTSLLYPLVLAPGYWLGFRGDRLLEFAAIVACTSTFATLLLSRRLFRGLPPLAAYLAAPFLLSIGALDWSLFSGMELALFLAAWAAAVIAWDDLVSFVPSVASPAPGAAPAAWLGLSLAILAATRPEAALIVALFSLDAARVALGRGGARSAVQTLLLAAVPAAVVVVGQAVANRLLTGDWSAAGAVVKLELNDPRLGAREIAAAWWSNVHYQVLRLTGHHVAEGLARGAPALLLPLAALALTETRRAAAFLVAQAVLWTAVVALNGQVRWQNERYTMPALAWLLLAGALGAGGLLAGAVRAPRGTRARPWTLGALTVALLGFLVVGQGPRFRDQVWFYGRASRNIRDQHVVAARRIREELPATRRVLVGDAGAIPYEADLPALDLVGLGGYPDLPFARAGRFGVGASLELLERIPSAQRPDLLAIYPGWWGDFPIWFGRPLGGVSVEGNVICGGRTKMLYAADWSSLEERPATIAPLSVGEQLVDRVDLGDILSEREHGARISGAPGHVAMRMLPVSTRASGVLWDAGRVVPPGASVTLAITGPAASRLLVRLAPAGAARLALEVDGVTAAEQQVTPAAGWVEPSLPLPPSTGPRRVVRLTVLDRELVLFHVFAVGAP
ncbi:MAG: hypothetical protein FJ104_07580 [Deltaproteobacteria bacterium]|nr:hypothetical protein [Deltaproteobacteria bacterium]